MKKIAAISTIILALVLVIIALFVGCSDDSAKPKSPEEQPGVVVEPGDEDAQDVPLQSVDVSGASGRILGLDVAQLKPEEAREKLTTAADQMLSSYELTLTYSDRIFSYTADKLGLSADIDGALAVAQGASGDVPVQVSMSEDALGRIVAEVDEQIEGKPVEPTAKFDQSVSGNFAFSEGQAGYAVDTDQLRQQIQSALNGEDKTIELEIPVTKTSPKHTLDELKQNVSRVSLFTTSYKDNAGKDRTENLRLGIEKLNGATVMPGQEFSFNKHIGPRDEANGYKKAATIVAGSIFEDDWGGGICQVSTNLYNAVLLANLEIGERHKHSIPSSYVPYGQDAAVVYGGKDFTFVNNTDYPIYIVASMDTNEKRLAIAIYGQQIKDGKTIKIKSVTKEEVPPAEPEVIEDETVEAGKKSTIKKARNGYIVEVYKQVYKNDEMIEEKRMYTDSYKPVQGVVSIGTMGAKPKKEEPKSEPKEEQVEEQSEEEESSIEEEVYIPEE